MKYKNVLFNIDRFKAPIVPYGDSGVEFNHEAGTFVIENFPAEAFKKFCRSVKDSGEKYVVFFCLQITKQKDKQ